LGSSFGKVKYLIILTELNPAYLLPQKLQQKTSIYNDESSFSLSTLTQFCDKAFGLGAKQVLDIAQSLYETHKVTSYPRSDCQYLPKSQISDIGSIFKHLEQQHRLK